MFRYIMLLSVLLSMMVGVATVAQEEEEEPPPRPVAGNIYGLVTVDLADIRTGPDFAYPTIGQLPLNASVVVYGRSGDFFNRWDGRQWLEIDYGNSHAWIYARLLRTSIAFNSIPPTGRLLPRNADGRVPDVFDLSTDLCAQWPTSPFTQSAGDFYGGQEEIEVTYPGMPGANVYSVIVISPEGVRRAFDSETTIATIRLASLPAEGGTYTWRVAPYWTDSPYRYRWQQVCLLRTGGTIEVPPYEERIREE
ncbi:SH3 domain-containing protein [Phototrophicus methaneseepsis]|uniref:SH3 domain-containing protein n=1 Tax=Phototrophicus methaneseepsis TaxID=2710758 RepID=A0A7S8IGD9_9CHLR|nr:SH3 domain-containing protein [Phototrophicus methaneseepsis]QPC84582.1 SH3 domain-containing protein [Phototrophicus methaneseepsis]